MYNIIITKEVFIMSEIFVTITGANHYYRLKPFKVGGIVKLEKDTDECQIKVKKQVVILGRM